MKNVERNCLASRREDVILDLSMRMIDQIGQISALVPPPPPPPPKKKIYDLISLQKTGQQRILYGEVGEKVFNSYINS